MTDQIDISNLTIPELDDLQKQIVAQRKKIEKKSLRDARAAAAAAAQAYGFSLEDIASADFKAPKTTAPAQYRNPENSEETWSGKGRRPMWFKDAIEAGASPEEMLINA